jgi:hypothetical protein
VWAPRVKGIQQNLIGSERYWTVTVMVTGVGLVTVADPAGLTAPVGVTVMM